MTVADIDLSDTVRASVETVEMSAAGTTFTGDVPLSNDQLKAMLSLTPSTSTIEHGSISNATHAWQTINLQGNYQNPVVILGDAIGGKLSDEATARLRNVSGNSFEMRIVEPVVDGNASYSRDNVLNPGEEVTINYMVVEAGTWTLADGTKISSGTTSLNSYDNFESVSISGDLSNPTVLTQLQGFENEKYVVTRTHNIANDSFNVLMETGKGISTASPQSESVGWIAIERGDSSSSDDSTIRAEITGQSYNNNSREVNYTSPFNSNPTLLAKLGSYYGGETANLRITSTSASGFSVFIDEEQTDGSNESHTWRISTTFLFQIVTSSSQLPIPTLHS